MAHENRRLTEREIQQVFRRAAELQENRGAELAEWGPTPADVMKLGEELGMDAASLRKAVDEVLAGPSVKKHGFFGGFVFESDHTFKADITDDEWHELIQVLRTKFGRTGTVSEVAGAREWAGSQGALDPVHLSARSKGGSTRVAIKSDIYGAAGILAVVAFFPLLLIALAISKGTNLPAFVELVISGGIFALATAGWRGLVDWMGRRRRIAIKETEQKIEELVDRIASAPSAQEDETEGLRLRT